MKRHKKEIQRTLLFCTAFILFAFLLSCKKKNDGTGISPNWPKKADLPGSGRETAVGFTIGTKAYIGTGYNASYLKDFWEFDPSSNVWTQKTDFGGSARYRATGFSLGNKGYIGMGYDGAYKSDWWEYDPVSNAWTQKISTPIPGRSNASALVIGGKAYVGTGWYHNGTTGAHYNDWWEFTPDSGTWFQKANVPGNVRSMSFEFTIGTKGYLGGGYNQNVYLSDFYEYDPAVNTWTSRTSFPTLRANAPGFELNGEGYVGTGYNGDGYMNDVWKYDPAADAWEALIDFAGSKRIHANGFSLNGKGYIGLGTDGDYKKDIFEYWP